ncbi:MAG TPA: hypothetical protein VLC98_12830 [Phnomibacter sp.]|nr:hypothetical protein [Phnomibacter sp.]
MDNFQLASIIAGIVFIVGLVGLIKQVRLTFSSTSIIKKFFLFLLVLLIVAAILAKFDIYFRGYWTTRILIWFFILFASLLFAFGDRFILTKPWRLFTGFIFYFPLASILWFFIVPFMGPVLSITIWGHILGSKDDIFYCDNDIRLQRVFHGALGPAGPPNYFKKSGVLEFDKGLLSVNFYETPDSLKIEKTKDTITVYFYHNRNYDTINPVSFKFKR